MFWFCNTKHLWVCNPCSGLLPISSGVPIMLPLDNCQEPKWEAQVLMICKGLLNVVVTEHVLQIKLDSQWCQWWNAQVCEVHVCLSHYLWFVSVFSQCACDWVCNVNSVGLSMVLVGEMLMFVKFMFVLFPKQKCLLPMPLLVIEQWYSI